MEDPIPYYRIVDWATAGACDECGDPVPGTSGVETHVDIYYAHRFTPCGVWLSECRTSRDREHERWIKADAIRQFACPTIALALTSFLARKLKQKRIYKARAKRAQIAHDLAVKRYTDAKAP